MFWRCYTDAKEYKVGDFQKNKSARGACLFLSDKVVGESELFEAAEYSIKYLKENPDCVFVFFNACLNDSFPREFYVTKYMNLEDFKVIVKACEVVEKNSGKKDHMKSERLMESLVAAALERDDREIPNEKQ